MLNLGKQYIQCQVKFLKGKYALYINIYIYLQTSKHKCAFMYDKVLLYDNMVYVPCPEHVKTKYVKVLYMAMVRHCIMGILALAILNPC